MTSIDYELLERKFYITRTEKEDVVFSMKAAELLREKNMDRFLRAYIPALKALEPAAAGTGFCSWFRSVCLAQQYAVSLCDTALDFSLSNLTVQLYLKDGWTWFAFKLGEGREISAPSVGREAWRADVFTTFYRGQVRPLFEAVARSAQADVGQLWGQLPAGFRNYVDTAMQEAGDDAARREQVSDDYRFLSQELDGAVFGRKRNPFDVKWCMIENPRDPAKPLRMKASCCMFYRTEGGSYCLACPRMPAAEREARGAKRLAEARP